MNQSAFQSVSPGNRFDDLPVLTLNGRFRPPASGGNHCLLVRGAVRSRPCKGNVATIRWDVAEMHHTVFICKRVDFSMRRPRQTACQHDCKDKRMRDAFLDHVWESSPGYFPA